MGMPKLNTQPSNGYGVLRSYVQRGSSCWPFSVFGLGWLQNQTQQVYTGPDKCCI